MRRSPPRRQIKNLPKIPSREKSSETWRRTQRWRGLFFQMVVQSWGAGGSFLPDGDAVLGSWALVGSPPLLSHHRHGEGALISTLQTTELPLSSRAQGLAGSAGSAQSPPTTHPPLEMKTRPTARTLRCPRMEGCGGLGREAPSSVAPSEEVSSTPGGPGAGLSTLVWMKLVLWWEVVGDRLVQWGERQMTKGLKS